MPVTRARLVKESASLRGAIYIWGAKGEQMINPDFLRWAKQDGKSPHPPHKIASPSGFALDCSGAVGLALARAGVPGAQTYLWGWSTDDYWNKLPEPNFPLPGDVALYGGSRPDDVSHIEMVLCADPTGEVGGIVIGGASGGDQTTTTQQAAELRHAGYKFKESHLYRPDFRGFRSIRPILGT